MKKILSIILLIIVCMSGLVISGCSGWDEESLYFEEGKELQLLVNKKNEIILKSKDETIDSPVVFTVEDTSIAVIESNNPTQENVVIVIKGLKLGETKITAIHESSKKRVTATLLVIENYYDTGAGTEIDPHKISYKNQLKQIDDNQQEGKYFKLMNDIKYEDYELKKSLFVNFWSQEGGGVEAFLTVTARL